MSAAVSRADDQDFKRFSAELGGVYVMPEEHFGGQLYQNTIEPTVGRTTVTGAVAPIINLEYFFTRCFSSELVLTVTKHDVMFGAGSVNAGSLWLLPPSLFVKYHPLPNCVISPYVGFGMDVVFPFNEKLTIGGHPQNFTVDDTVGWAVKLGFDVPLYKCKCFDLYYNVDAMYYNTDTSVLIGGLGKFTLDLNPVIISSGIKVRF